MSVSWSLQVLCASDQLLPDQFLGMMDQLEQVGFIGASTSTGSVQCMTADGSGTLLFESTRAAFAWMSTGEGLIGLRHTGLGFEVDVSIHRRDGVLPLEMADLDDTPLFDVISFTVSDRVFREAGRASTWDALRQSFGMILAHLPFIFAYAADDLIFEAVAPFACIHRRIAGGLLPPFVCWMSAGVANSPIGYQLQNVASVIGRSAIDIGEVRVLQLTEGPWDSALEAVLEASQTWRRATGDKGC